VANEVMPDQVQVVLMLCCVKPIVANCTIFPVFTPTEYLFENYKKNDDPKWMIYADAVRDLLCEKTGLKKCDQTYRELRQYYRYLIGKEKSYIYNPDTDVKKKA
jgi:hypothetical protein